MTDPTPPLDPVVAAPSVPDTDDTGPVADAPGDSGPPSDGALAEAARAIEAIVMVSSDPISDQLLAQLLELPTAHVRRLCVELAAAYAEERRGFQLVEVAGGWRFQSHPDLAPYIERYVLEGQTARLSNAALETLAIVAYKQPLSRAQMSAIRGVNVDGVLRTLVHKGYVAEIGRDAGPGQAVLFGTTDLFLERLGLASLSDLPPLGEFVPDARVVEALEQTLLVVDDPALPFDDADTDGGEDPGRAGDETIDLTDDRTDDLTDGGAVDEPSPLTP